MSALLICTQNTFAAEKVFDAHNSAFSYFFQDGDMDFHFGNLILGSAVNGGVEIGEAFYAASRIKDGDAKSWHKEWFELAQRIEKRGMRSLKEGHKVSARDQLLRAANYYRISLLGMLPDNPQLEIRGIKSRSLMKKAGTLFDPPLEYIEIPFEKTVLPGYFRKANNSGNPTKTLLMIGGGETFIEDLVFYIAPQAYARGYNFMTIDLPGQGMMPHSSNIFRTDSHLAMKKAVDYALSRAEVNPQKLGAYGISGGGLFVPQAAMHDQRIKAIAMSSAVMDSGPMFDSMPVTKANAKEMKNWSSFHENVVKNICWRYGIENPSELVEVNRANIFDPKKIMVPALSIVGEGEYESNEVKKQQKMAMDGFPNKKSKLVVTPSDEGATNHCIMENRSLVGQVVLDWMDEIFK